MGGAKLVPDMAFCIPKEYVNIPMDNNNLAIIRKDGELDNKANAFFANIEADKMD